jgi:hypothetical protein
VDQLEDALGRTETSSDQDDGRHRRPLGEILPLREGSTLSSPAGASTAFGYGGRRGERLVPVTPGVYRRLNRFVEHGRSPTAPATGSSSACIGSSAGGIRDRTVARLNTWSGTRHPGQASVAVYKIIRAVYSHAYGVRCPLRPEASAGLRRRRRALAVLTRDQTLTEPEDDHLSLGVDLVGAGARSAGSWFEGLIAAFAIA